MPRHNFAPITGKFTRFSFDSALLENRLGDPTERDVLVHITKEGLDLISNGEKLPVLIYLAPLLRLDLVERIGKLLVNPYRKDTND